MSVELTESSQTSSETSPAMRAQGQVGMGLVELAQRIKQLRMDKRLTIEQLATQTGLTRSWLSKVENFRVTPSLPALFKIAANLGVRLSELVDGLDDSPELCVVRKGEGKRIDRDSSPDNDTVYESLAHHRQNRAMEPFLLTIPAHGGRKQLLPHDGEEYLMVISGDVSFVYGEEELDLAAGDSLYLNGSTPHRVHNPHDQPATVLCVFFVPPR